MWLLTRAYSIMCTASLCDTACTDSKIICHDCWLCKNFLGRVTKEQQRCFVLAECIHFANCMAHGMSPFCAAASSGGGCSTAKAAPTSMGSPSEVPVPCISSIATDAGFVSWSADRMTCTQVLHLSKFTGRAVHGSPVQLQHEIPNVVYSNVQLTSALVTADMERMVPR